MAALAQELETAKAEAVAVAEAELKRVSLELERANQALTDLKANNQATLSELTVRHLGTMPAFTQF